MRSVVSASLATSSLLRSTADGPSSSSAPWRCLATSASTTAFSASVSPVLSTPDATATAVAVAVVAVVAAMTVVPAVVVVTAVVSSVINVPEGSVDGRTDSVVLTNAPHRGVAAIYWLAEPSRGRLATGGASVGSSSRVRFASPPSAMVHMGFLN